MRIAKDIDWFKHEIAPSLPGYDLNYKFFKHGDFGSLNQVEFNSERIGGNVDFWEQGWLGIYVWDYKKEKQLLNVLVNPDQEIEKQKAFDEFKNLVMLSN